MSRKHSKAPEITKCFSTFPCIARSLADAVSACLDTRIPRDRYLIDHLMSKYAGVGSATLEERQSVAFSQTLADEAANLRTNSRILSDSTFHRWGLRWDTVVSVARGIIADLVGEHHSGIYEAGRFTSGAAVGFNYDRRDPWYKFNSRVTVTPAAARRTIALIMSTPLWRATCEARYGSNPLNWVEIVDGNIGFTVPKNAKTERFACKEPTGNMLLQSAIGAHFRRSLRHAGIDLNDQSRNRRMARQASIDGLHATIDLASASNSVTLALCYLLLPSDWYGACASARCPTGVVGGTHVKWEMMSSMGNGFTFELESLLFYALSESVRRLTRTHGRISIYGDDIVAPTACVHALISVLGYAGFRVNKEKSFVSGPIRESCGGHYHNGSDITPVYIRKPITDTSRVIWFLNAVRRWAGCESEICDPRLESLYFKVRNKYVSADLWGGVRLSSISSLATPHRQRWRLKLLNESSRIDGVGAVLRTFMYRSAGEADEGYGGKPTMDPQRYYEMFGSVPVSSDMSRLVTVSGPVAVESNSELFPERLPYFPRECGSGLIAI